MILIAAYLAEACAHRWRHPAALATLSLLGAAALLLIAVPGAMHFYLPGASLPIEFWNASAATLIGGGAIAWLGRRYPVMLARATRLDATPALGFLPVLLLLAALNMTVVFGLVLPGADRYGQRKPFALALAKQLKSDESLVFYKRPNTTLVFYLNPGDPIPVINNKSEMSKYGAKPVLIADAIDQKELIRAFPELANAIPMLETQGVSKRLSSDKENLIAYRLF